VLGSPLYRHAWSFWLCIWLAAGVSAALGTLIGAPTLRVRGDYLAIITLGFGEIIPVAIRNLGDITIEIGGWRPIERLNLTGGENGVNPVGRPYLPGVPFETDPMPWYYLILVIGALSLWAMSRLQDSRLGRAWMAIREDETAADCTGVNPISTKLLAFALGASFSGFAGSVYAAKLQAITPGAFEFQVSIMLLCMVVLGRRGHAAMARSSAPCSSPCSIASFSRRPRSSRGGSAGVWACPGLPPPTSPCGAGSSSAWPGAGDAAPTAGPGRAGSPPMRAPPRSRIRGARGEAPRREAIPAWLRERAPRRRATALGPFSRCAASPSGSAASSR
jgi:hypothetical protein